MSVTVLSFPPSDSPSIYSDGSSQPETGLSHQGTRNEDEAEPPSQGQHRRTWLNFDAAFPSIVKTAIRLRDARDNNTLEAFIAIADVFIMCAKTAIHEIHRSCVNSDPDGSYELAKSAAELVISLMHGKIRMDVKDSGAVNMVLDLSDMVVANLKELTKVALHITRDKKPLPPVPTAHEELSESTGKLSATENRISFLDYELVNSDEYEESYGTTSYKFLFGNSLRGLFKSSLSATSSEQLSSATTVVGDDFSQSSVSGNTAVPKGTQDATWTKHSDIPYVLRQSAYFLHPDASSFERDAEESLPTKNTKSVCFNGAGEVKGASFSALVRMLTSKDAIFDPDLVPTFFAGFRIFGSVMLFLEELKRKFDEEAPGNLDTIQLRVWAGEAFHTRLRIGKILLLWLTDYWQPIYDDEVLGHLHQFAVERIRNELPRSLAVPILEMIDSRMTGDEVYVTSHKDRYFKILANQVKQTKTVVTGFSYPDMFDDDIDNVLALFDTDVGKEEFTQQLTAIASAMFRKVNPQDVVMYWHKHSDSGPGPALSEATNFARSLAMFVTCSIATQQEKALRCRRIEFWISIATSCLHHRNYFTSRCVFAGITHSAISRLKRTILDLSKQAKVNFRRLDQFFSGHLNHARVRKAMAEKTAATLPLLVPLKQDIASLKQVPRTIEPDDTPDDQLMVNLVPYRVLMKTMRAMESSLIPYGFPKNARFERWLNEVLRAFPVDKDDELYRSCYQESCRFEPRDEELERFSSTWIYYQATKKIIQELPPDEDLLTQKDVPRKGAAKPLRLLLDALKR